MRVIEPITEEEMVAEFLRGEITSTRWSECITGPLLRDSKERGLIENPDVKNHEENRYRASILGEYRGYGRNTILFLGFPADVVWKRVSLDKNDLLRVRYLNHCKDWIALSGGTRRVADGAEGVRNGGAVD